jgi:DNA repair protein RadC
MNTELLSDAELFSTLVGTSIETSQKFIHEFGTLERLLSCSEQELSIYSELDILKKQKILCAKEISKRIFLDSNNTKKTFITEQDFYQLFKDLVLEEQEVVAAVYLTSKNTLIRKKEIFRGGIDCSFARAREIISNSLKFHSTKLVVAHNHPSQINYPSHEDVLFTAKLEHACQFFGITLLDHFIICKEEKYFSFKKANLLTAKNPLSKKIFQAYHS